MNQVNASRFPAVAFVETLFVDNYRTVGTATLIGPRLLLTAGHVVYDHYRVRNGQAFLAPDGTPSSISVTLGGSVSQRFTIKASGCASNATWVNKQSKAPVATRIRSSFDFGAIILPTPVDTKVGGVFLPQTTSSSTIVTLPLDVGGYDAKKFFNSNPQRPLSNMFVSDATSHQLLSGFPDRLSYSVPTVAGMSGGPVWSFDSASGNRTIRAIHTSFIDGVGGCALRVTDEVAAYVHQWQGESHPALAKT